VFPVAPEKLKLPEKACPKELFVKTARRSNAANPKRDISHKRLKTALTEWGRGAAQGG
jgi:hypothetical protein